MRGVAVAETNGCPGALASGRQLLRCAVRRIEAPRPRPHDIGTTTRAVQLQCAILHVTPLTQAARLASPVSRSNNFLNWCGSHINGARLRRFRLGPRHFQQHALRLGAHGVYLGARRAADQQQIAAQARRARVGPRSYHAEAPASQ